MALSCSARSCSGEQPRRRLPSNRSPAPQLPGRNKKKNLSLLTASAIQVAGSVDDTTETNGTDANKGDISIKGIQGEVSGDNKSDIGKSDGEIGDDNDGNNKIDGNEDDNDGDGVIDSNSVNPGGDNKVGDYNDGDGGDEQVGDDPDGNGGIDRNEVNKGGTNSAPSNESNSEDDSSTSSGNEGFIVAAHTEPGPCVWMSAHQCIWAMEAPVWCKGNSASLCLRTVHQECLLAWEHTLSASTIRGANPKGTNCLVCLMHHPQYQVKRWKAFQSPPKKQDKGIC